MCRPSIGRLGVPRTTADQVYNCCRSRRCQDNTKSKSTEKGYLGTSSDSLDIWKVSTGDCLGIKLGSTWAESVLPWGRGCHLAGIEARPSLEVALQFQKDNHSFSMY